MFIDYLKVFLTGGFICFIGQIIVIKTKFTPTRILVSFLVLGMILEYLGIYEAVIEFGKAGAQVPITGFGATLARGVIAEVDKEGLIGILTGGLKASAAGVSAAIFFSYIIALIFDSKSKKD
jgi:stage V sporulation protein AE